MPLLDRSPLLADVLPRGDYTNNFDYCVKIVNLNQYPKHQFFIKISSANPTLSKGGYLLANSSLCVPMNGYRPIAKIAAISKNLVKPKDLLKTDAGVILQNNQLEKSLIVANITIDRPGYLPSSYKNKKVVAEVKIKSVNPKTLVISSPETAPKIPNWLVFPLIGLAILGWTVAKRKQQQVSGE